MTSWKLPYVTEAAETFTRPFSASHVYAKLHKRKSITMAEVAQLLTQVDGVVIYAKRDGHTPTMYEWAALRDDDA